MTPLSLGVSAFDLPQHRALTEEVLAAVRVTIQGRARGFSDYAIKQIRQFNDATDALSTAALFDPEKHFTNEAFTASTEHLLRLKQQVLENVRLPRPQPLEARAMLGQALHVVQDFYAHSNWVELGRSGIESSFGRSLLDDPSPTLQACPSEPWTLGPGGGGGLTSGYFLGYTANVGCGALPYPGKCHHGNYFLNFSLCEGINKDKPGQGSPSEFQAAMAAAREAT